MEIPGSASKSCVAEADRSEGKVRKARCNEWTRLNGQLILFSLSSLTLSAEAYVGVQEQAQLPVRIQSSDNDHDHDVLGN
jgi:hypothetical protein